MKNQHITNDNNNRQQIMHENWQVMKPFVHFAFKAIAVIGSALIGIIKLLPLLAEHKPDRKTKDNRIIKI
jgi:hypothetical protein